MPHNKVDQKISYLQLNDTRVYDVRACSAMLAVLQAKRAKFTQPNCCTVQRHVKSMHISILRVYCVYAACILLYAFLPLCMVHHKLRRATLNNGSDDDG